MSKPTPDPRIDELHDLLDQYERARRVGGPEANALEDDIVWLMVDDLRTPVVYRTSNVTGESLKYQVDGGIFYRTPWKMPKSHRKAG